MLFHEHYNQNYCTKLCQLPSYLKSNLSNLPIKHQKSFHYCCETIWTRKSWYKPKQCFSNIFRHARLQPCSWTCTQVVAGDSLHGGVHMMSRISPWRWKGGDKMPARSCLHWSTSCGAEVNGDKSLASQHSYRVNRLCHYRRNIKWDWVTYECVCTCFNTGTDNNVPMMARRHHWCSEEARWIRDRHLLLLWA